MEKFWSFSRKFTLILLLFLIAIKVLSQNLSVASFSRLGFGSRGIGLGNAMVSVIQGEIVGYYNPAISAFSKSKSASFTFGILSLDRTLNFLHYTQSLRPTAGFSIYAIKAGVKNIDLRDVDGYHVGNINTEEYLFGFSFSNKIFDRLSIGLALKLYLNQLYQEVKSQTFGIDFGFLAKLKEFVTFGFSIHDINAKYRWDSSIIYREKGRTITESFPTTTRFGLSYTLQDAFIASTGLTFISNKKLINLGLEIYPLYLSSVKFRETICFRGGINFTDNPNFSIGFGLTKKVGNFIMLLDYSYKSEKFSPSGMQFLSVGLKL